MYGDNHDLDKLTRQALLIEIEEARQAGTVGFMARVLTQATMPHKAYINNEFTRHNGYLTLTMWSPRDIGLPYGSIPRLLLSWITTEAVRTKSPVIELGPSLSAFMAVLGLASTGGQWGSITRLKNQIERLFSCMVSCRYQDTEEGKSSGAGFVIAKEYRLWWNPKAKDQIPLWKSTVTLSTDFFEEIINRPVPVDMRALKALKRSPMALDIYCWLTYRMSYLRKPIKVTWLALQIQFGADYSKNAHGLRNFKLKFLHHLRRVLIVYPEANVEDDEKGLLLKPSKPHVAQLPPAPEPLLLPIPIHQEEHQGPLLQTSTYERARKAAPGWDVYELERQWREWITKKGAPEKPDAAFVAFCRKKALRETAGIKTK